MSASPSNHPAILPLLTTTASLATALYETIVYRGLIKSLPSPLASPSSSPFARTDRHAVARTISLWWRMNIAEGLTLIVAMGIASLVAGTRAVRRLGSDSSEKWVAIAGTVFAVGHFGFGPSVAKVIEGMAYAYEKAGIWTANAAGAEDGALQNRKRDKREDIDPDLQAEIQHVAAEEARSEVDVVDDRVIELQRKWLRLHYWRTLAVDLPAMICFSWLAFKRR